jgi:hypothetical protein
MRLRRVPYPFRSLIVERVGERRSQRSEAGIGNCRIPPLRQKQLRLKDGAPGDSSKPYRRSRGSG